MGQEHGTYEIDLTPDFSAVRQGMFKFCGDEVASLRAAFRVPTDPVYPRVAKALRSWIACFAVAREAGATRAELDQLIDEVVAAYDEGANRAEERKE
jgi:hypothetical protein